MNVRKKRVQITEGSSCFRILLLISLILSKGSYINDVRKKWSIFRPHKPQSLQPSKFKLTLPSPM